MGLDSPSWDPHCLGTCSKDNSVIIWQVTAGTAQRAASVKRVALCTGHTNTVTGVKFSHQKHNSFVVTVSNDTTLKLWPLKPLQLKKKTDGE